MVSSYWNKDLCFHRRAEGTKLPASHQASQEHQFNPSPPSGDPVGTQQALTQDLHFQSMSLVFYNFTSCGGVWWARAGSSLGWEGWSSPQGGRAGSHQPVPIPPPLEGPGQPGGSQRHPHHRRPDQDVSLWVGVSWAEVRSWTMGRAVGQPRRGRQRQSGMSVPSWLSLHLVLIQSEPSLATWVKSTRVEITISSTRHSKVCLIPYESFSISLLQHSLSHIANSCPSGFVLAFISFLMRTISMVDCLDLQGLSLRLVCLFVFVVFILLCFVLFCFLNILTAVYCEDVSVQLAYLKKCLYCSDNTLKNLKSIIRAFSCWSNNDTNLFSYVFLTRTFQQAGGFKFPRNNLCGKKSIIIFTF